LFYLLPAEPRGAKHVKWSEHAYPLEIVRRLDGVLADVTDEELDQAEEEGFLAGNAMYRGIGRITSSDLARAIALEQSYLQRIMSAADFEAEALAVDEERLEAFDAVEELWGLDLGVASAVAAVVGLGGTPVSSCNAGGFGGHHSGTHPHVAFYLPPDRAERFLTTARAADVGLVSAEDGLARLYADRDLALIGFAQAALRKLAA